MMPHQQASPAAYVIVQDSETLRLVCYFCPSGVPTVGWGHTGPDVKMGMAPITKERADQLLRSDMAKFERMLNERATVGLAQHQFDALVSFLFNVGPGRKAGTNGPKDAGRAGLFMLPNGNPSTLWRRVCAGDHGAAANEFGKWVNGTDPKTGQLVKLPGLVIRRAREAALYRGEKARS